MQTFVMCVCVCLCAPPFVNIPCVQGTCNASSGASVDVNSNSLQLVRSGCYITFHIYIYMEREREIYCKYNH
jgi:hypothetical protein